MGLVNEYTTVGLNSSVISYYENLGYKIPRSIDNQGRLRIPRGTTIDVKTTDLMPSSNQIIEARCDYCNKIKKFNITNTIKISKIIMEYIYALQTKIIEILLMACLMSQ